MLEFQVDIKRLHKTPSLGRIRSLAATLRELRPHLLRNLQQTTIHVQKRLQQRLLQLVFRMQPPATPIRVVRHGGIDTPCAASIADEKELDLATSSTPMRSGKEIKFEHALRGGTAALSSS